MSICIPECVPLAIVTFSVGGTLLDVRGMIIMTDIHSLSSRIPGHRQTNEQASVVWSDVLRQVLAETGYDRFIPRREGEHLFYSTESKMT